MKSHRRFLLTQMESKNILSSDLVQSKDKAGKPYWDTR